MSSALASRSRDAPQLRVLYLSGMGDTLGAYRMWRANADDRGELAPTYSGMVFGACRELGAAVLAVSAHTDRGSLTDGDVRIVARPVPFHTRGGVIHHLGHALYAVRILLIALRFRPAVIIASTQLIWILVAPATWFGIRIVPSLHNTLWPKGHRPNDLKSRVLLWLDGLFWRRYAYAGIAVSSEILTQIRDVARETRCNLRSVLPQYATEFAMPEPPTEMRPFRVLFAGRVEANKGIWDLLEAASALERDQPGAFEWEIAGIGSQAAPLASAISTRGLERVVKCLGWLGDLEFERAMRRCHVVAAPTRQDFAEGFQKVTAESVLFGRPVVTTPIVPATETFGDACEICEPGDARSLASAVRRLAEDPKLYAGRREACRRLRGKLFDRSLGYRPAIEEVLRRVAAEETARNVRRSR